MKVYFSSSKFYFYCGSIPKSWETREKIAEKKQEKKNFWMDTIQPLSGQSWSK